jgi:nucleoside-diphosphate-sugar epimerase
MDAYGRSKVLAERAAWEFAESHPEVALTTLLPVAVMGPLMGDAVSGSNHLLLSLLTGEMSRYPDLYVPVVDVRDVAAAHVAALGTEDAVGERFLVASGDPAMSLAEISALLRRSFPGATQKVPTKGVPDLVVRLAARFRPEYRGPAAELGLRKQVVIDKARRVLGLDPRPSRAAIVDAARDMIERGLA